MHRIQPAIVLVIFTVLIWISRLRNIWTDAGQSFFGKVAWTVPVLLFLVLAALVIRAKLVPASRPHFVGAVRLLGGWTVVYWLFRSVRLFGGGHSFGFIVVHMILTALSIGLAIWSWPRTSTHQLSRMRTGR